MGKQDTIEVWAAAAAELLRTKAPFAAHLARHQALFADYPASAGPAPVWAPSPTVVTNANVTCLQRTVGVDSYEQLRLWSVRHRATFWRHAMAQTDIVFRTPATSVCAAGAPEPHWLPDAVMNICDSCLRDGEAPAIVYSRSASELGQVSRAELAARSGRVAKGLRRHGIRAGDAVAIAMPMTVDAVAAYLGILRAGAVVVSIADSFAAAEIATRLRLAHAQLVITQDVTYRGDKTLPMYEKVVAAGTTAAVVIDTGQALPLRQGDLAWDDFLADEADFPTVAAEPQALINILFSSGTTGDPKVIPWDHSTAIKCAVDACYHHDVKAGDVLAWPTNLGWMMGPWLIFASLINGATMALFDGLPTVRAFGEFVEHAGVTMLGVVPSLVSAWRRSSCMEGLDWSAIKVFSSTGECSNAEDMFYLMWLAGYRPVIEYCGGTEIGGGYITGAVVRPCAPATFNTIALGLDIVILDEQDQPTDNGEAYLVPPSIGLSRQLLGRDHDLVYFANTPAGPCGEQLRRHGDQIERLPNNYYRAHGRVDDTMNLGGIKVSSVEVERVVTALPTVAEAAAIAVPPTGGGPSRLVVFAVAQSAAADAEELRATMQQMLRDHLNPLFKIHRVIIADALPRTASNKIMRRVLRQRCADLAL